MKAVERTRTHRARFDIRLAAGCMTKNESVAMEVIADEHAQEWQRRDARELIRVTELNLTVAVQAYLRRVACNG